MAVRGTPSAARFAAPSVLRTRLRGVARAGVGHDSTLHRCAPAGVDTSAADGIIIVTVVVAMLPPRRLLRVGGAAVRVSTK
mmetsp:Transcript_36836/g.90157  ORF Transcript_36836/g.90157 Transcript_36836/m.90157 type:complete len:81 (-) Transcript_36836:163-405(-)